MKAPRPGWGVSPLLHQTLQSTNVIESCLATVRHVARHVKRRPGGDHIARCIRPSCCKRR